MNQIYGFEGEVKAKYTAQMFALFSEVFEWLPLAQCINGKVLVRGHRLHPPTLSPSPRDVPTWGHGLAYQLPVGCGGLCGLRGVGVIPIIGGVWVGGSLSSPVSQWSLYLVTFGGGTPHHPYPQGVVGAPCCKLGGVPAIPRGLESLLAPGVGPHQG